MSRVRLSLSHRAFEDSPSCLLRLRLALFSNWAMSFICQLLFFLSLVRFCFCSGSSQATIRCWTVVSALTPMAQTKPSSSRATAVMIFRWSLPAAASLQ